jgi:four helix bundle protein
MIIRDHQNIAAWQLAKDLERRVWAFTDAAPANRDGHFCQQIRDSSSSASSNIAEGFGRFWPLDFAHRLRIAIGELRETQNHLITARDRKYLTQATHDELFRLADRAIGAAVNFVKYLESAGPDWKTNYRARQRQLRNTPTQARTEPEEPSEPSEPEEPQEPAEPKQPKEPKEP